MLQLRIHSPSEPTKAVLALLGADSAVVNLALMEGSALSPPGDLVLCDVARDGANTVLAALRDLGVGHHGSIALQHVDVTIGDLAEEAGDQGGGEGGEAAVWEEVAARTQEDSELTVGFLTFLVFAALIAAVGLIQDAPILIVGAMVVGPEFGPIAGLSFGLVSRRLSLVRTASTTLVVGLAAGAISTFASTQLAEWFDLIPAGFSPSAQPLTGFIVDPSVLSFGVALLAGVVGTLSLTQEKSGALIGVLISVTTLPAVAAIGVSGALGTWDDTRGAIVQLFLNVFALVLVGVVTLWLQRRADEHEARRRLVR